MEKYERVQQFEPAKFRRLIGVRPETFQEMIVELEAEEKKRRRRGGRVHRLALEDRLMMTLEYLREYRTYFHLGQSYGLSESACYRICRWVEDVLVKSGLFSLPGKKALLTPDAEFEVILIDAAESPIERPKKKS